MILEFLSPDFFLADAASDILENSEETSRAIRESFSQTWQQTIKGPLYAEVAAIGAGIAVIFLGIWAAFWLRSTLDSGVKAKDFHDLVVPILIVILLGNPANRGTLFGEFTLQLHNAMNVLGEQILVKLDEEIEKKDVTTQAIVKTDAQTIVSKALNQCAPIKEKEKRNDCFNNASEQIIDLLEPYKGDTWARDMIQDLSAQIAKAQGSGYSNSDFFARLFGGLGGVVNPITTQISVGFFISVGAAFQWVLEHVAILTGMLGPLFLGASLLPVPGKPIIMWLSSFVGLGLMKISYSIVVSLAALQAVDAGSNSDPMIFPLIAGIFGPIIAIGMGSLGGVGLFASVLRLGSFFTGKM